MTNPRLDDDIRFAITELTKQDLERRGAVALARRVVATPPLIEYAEEVDLFAVRLPDGELVATFSGNLVTAAVASDRLARQAMY